MRLRRVVIVALVIVAPIALHSVWDYIEVRRLIREIEAIRDKGEPVTLQDARLRFILPAARVERVRHADERAGAGSYYVAAGRLAAGSQPYGGRLRPVQEWLAGVAPPPPLAATAERLHRFVDQWQDSLALADTAASLRFDGFPAEAEGAGIAERVGINTAIPSSLSTIGSLNNVAELISIRTVALSLAGNGDEAVDSAISGLRVIDALGDARRLAASGPQVSAILSLSRPSADALRRLQDALEAADRPEEPVERVMQQRARYLEMFWYRYYGPDARNPRDYRLPRRSALETIVRPWWTHLAVDVLRMWAELIEAARTPWPQKSQGAAEVTRKYSGTTPRYLNPAWLLVSRSYVGGAIALRPFQASVRPDMLMINRTSRVAVAVERYRRDHEGALPSALTELVPEYLAHIPDDPLTGRPLQYRPEADAYTIYSVAPDGKDDGGVLMQEAPPISGAAFMQGPDMGVRVLLGR